AHAGGEPDRRRGREGREDRGLSLPPGGDDPEREGDGAEQRAEPEDRRRNRPVAGVDAEVAARPDPEDRRGIDLPEQVAEVVVVLGPRRLRRAAAGLSATGPVRPRIPHGARG